MLSEEILARLEGLNRRRLPAPMKPVVVKTIEEAFGSQVRDRPQDAASPVSDEFSLAKLAPGEVFTDETGACYVIRRPLAEIWPGVAAHLEAERSGMELPAAEQGRRAAPMQRELAMLAEHFPQRAIFLDLETCGFAGSAIFLVGLIYYVGGELVLEQLLARTYAEEPAMLAALWQRVPAQRVLVTFNGKSFDWPMVHDRSTYHRLDRPATPSTDLPEINGHVLRVDQPHTDLVHIDLLHHARRRWRRNLPNCKLQTLERFVCRRVRQDDIPGSQVPQEYHHFVRTGDARMLHAILHHNALDLVTLAELTLRMMTPPPTEPTAQ